jgi:hypothetical protein
MIAAMPVTRLDNAGLIALLGEPAIANLHNKHRGGEAGLKGPRYEQLFGAHRIARLLRKLIDQGVDAFVEWQSNAFVDDFVVRRDEACSFKGYQLKNAQQVSWTAGAPSIADDFANQHSICANEGYEDIRMRLVCSSETEVAKLQNNVPGGIAPFTKAFHFPWHPSVLEIIRLNPWMGEDFGYLSKNPQPSQIETEQVAAVLMGAWDVKAPSACVSSVLDKARHMSPTLLRTRQPDHEAEAMLSPEFAQILNGLPDFQYDIRRGFLRWSAFGNTTAGALSFDCFSDQFASLQEHIVNLHPTTFEQIEGVLT